jgi:hypothetical protein
MDLDVIYNELDKQLEQINRRLIVIEGKLDESANRDHLHELRIQKLELALENTRTENLAERMRTIEALPDKKKAGFVNTVLDRAFYYLIGIVLSAITAYITIFFGKK